MAERKKSGASRLGVWVIVGLLCLGMVGFGAAGLSGTARSIGKAGDKTITVNQYYNTLNSQIANVERQIGRRLSAVEIQTLGIENNALARVVNQRALDNEAGVLGVSMGDDRVAEQLQSFPAFSSFSGTFDRVAYSEFLDRSNMNAEGFEDSLREDNVRALLQQAVVSGIEAPEPFSRAIISHLQETRDFRWARVESGDFATGTVVPSEDDLIAFHQDNPAAFTQPASKNITYAWLTPDMLSDSIDVSDDDIAAEYEARFDDYNQPETRLVERLVFPDDAAAAAAKAAIDAGTDYFDNLVTARGLTLDDVDLGEVTLADLGDAGTIVFGLTEPGVTVPAPTSLGPALFRVSAILDAQVQTLDEVRDDIRQEIALVLAAREIDAQMDDIEDLLAGGATLEETSAETNLELGTIAFNAVSTDTIAGYEEFQTLAATITQDDFPELAGLSDGGIFAARLDGETDAQLRPFEDVRDDVEAAWVEAEQRAALRIQADALVEQIKAGDSLPTLGLTEQIEEDALRTDFLDNAPPALVSTAFELTPGDAAIVEDVDGFIVVKLDAIHAANLDSEEAQALLDLANQRLANGLQSDVFNSFAQAVQTNTNIEIDTNVVQSVNSQVRGTGR